MTVTCTCVALAPITPVECFPKGTCTVLAPLKLTLHARQEFLTLYYTRNPEWFQDRLQQGQNAGLSKCNLPSWNDVTVSEYLQKLGRILVVQFNVQQGGKILFLIGVIPKKNKLRLIVDSSEGSLWICCLQKTSV